MTALGHPRAEGHVMCVSFLHYNAEKSELDVLGVLFYVSFRCFNFQNLQKLFQNLQNLNISGNRSMLFGKKCLPSYAIKISNLL